MRIILLFVALLWAAGCCTRAVDSRLSGTFVSDKAETLAYLESTGAYDAKVLELFEGLLGKLEVTYDGDMFLTVMDEYAENDQFRVLETGPDFVVIESPFFDDLMTTSRLEFVAGGYWLNSSMMEPPYKEKFTRVRADRSEP